MKRLAEIFWECFKISLFVIGGGYAILSVADAVFSRRKWIEEGELVDHLPVFQTIPGIIASHTAVYIGRKRAGLLGAAVAVLAVALPSICIFVIVSQHYRSLPLDDPWLAAAFVGLRAALAGVVFATVLRSWRRNLPDVFAYAVMALSLAALVAGAPVWTVLLGAMGVGAVAAMKRREGRVSSPAWVALFLFLEYGALCFGGGFVLVPMYIQDFVGANAPFLRISAEEFSNITALTQMTPGPIGVNGATFFGYRIFGIVGAVAASVALLLPGAVLCYLALASLERFKSNRTLQGVLRGVRPASIALMLVALHAFAGMCLFPQSAGGSLDPVGAVLFAGVTLAILKRWLGPVAMILVSAGLAVAFHAVQSLL